MSRVAVVGAGLMGSEIALMAALAGHHVTLVDIDEGALTRGLGHARAAGERMVRRGRLAQEDLDAAVARVSTATDVTAVAACDPVIEAVPERMDLKRQVLARIAAAVPPATVVASNTSGLSITELGAAAAPAGRVVGLHFFNPPSVMRLVEVIRGADTAEDVARRAAEFAAGLGKTPVAVRECPGFVVNRVLLRAMVAGFVATGEGDPAQADAAVVAAGPSPMGPHALADLVGLDTYEHIRGDLQAAYGDRFDDRGVGARMVAAGRLGRKNGGGFFDGPVPPTEAPQDLARSVGGVYYEAARDEAERLAAEGIASREDIDTAVRLGAGWEAGPLGSAG
ncbi:MAG: 3-hydroxyacyl-CoA dehydrogenase family protein [Thermoleophilia bacterium]|nr:3-hydroxyacyl-CoA dehydrogenase family protein [Thermoleophilia bacterium]